jgi:4-diphosphocytidyl-2C-methyl-D-erythritol kinase
MLVYAPAKLNLCLYLGEVRDDGLHELCSLFEPLALADPIEVTEAERDEVLCPGVDASGPPRARLGAPAASHPDREAHTGSGRAGRR